MIIVAIKHVSGCYMVYDLEMINIHTIETLGSILFQNILRSR